MNSCLCIFHNQALVDCQQVLQMSDLCDRENDNHVWPQSRIGYCRSIFNMWSRHLLKSLAWGRTPAKYLCQYVHQLQPYWLGPRWPWITMLFLQILSHCTLQFGCSFEEFSALTIWLRASLVESMMLAMALLFYMRATSEKWVQIENEEIYVTSLTARNETLPFFVDQISFVLWTRSFPTGVLTCPFCHAFLTHSNAEHWLSTCYQFRRQISRILAWN